MAESIIEARGTEANDEFILERVNFKNISSGWDEGIVDNGCKYSGLNKVVFDGTVLKTYIDEDSERHYGIIFDRINKKYQRITKGSYDYRIENTI